ncbi:MAG: hypothetical protein JKX94_10760 [Sneathiella sp.]|nr:hypothetical protein [Sneathiella sp.]
MARFPEILWSLFGCYRLALRDEKALSYFNLSEKGFWSSFTAILVAIPILCVQNLLGYNFSATGISLLPFLLLYIVTMVITWGLYLAAIGFASKYLNVSDKFSVFVIVYNWAQVALMALWLPFFILTLGLLGPEITSVFGLLFVVISYVFLWFVLKATLEIPGPTAAALAFLEFIFSLTAQQIFYSLLPTFA